MQPFVPSHLWRLLWRHGPTAVFSEAPAVFIYATVVVLIRVCFLGVGIANADSIDDGAGYLAARQQADGSWISPSTTSSHTTAEALRALQTVNGDQTARTAAADHLAAHPIVHTDDRARIIEALSAEGRDVTSEVANLLADADPNGGWGLTSAFSADPLDTALVLLALAEAGSTNTSEISPALSFLIAQQNPDGGWGCVRDGPSDVSCTAQVLFALSRYSTRFSFGTAIPDAQAFLKSALNPDGSIGGIAADPVYTTALATQALAASGDNLGSDRQTITSFLESKQNTDGSWGGDPLLTAVALRGLHRLSAVPTCGDGIVNQLSETCDELDLGGETCSSLGLGSGTLRCNADCTFDTSDCGAAPVCGDGVRNQSSELCDGSDLGGASCSSIGFGDGVLQCMSDCVFDPSGCSSLPTCGDGVRQQNSESCDGTDFGGESCDSLGLGSGDLDCTIDQLYV